MTLPVIIDTPGALHGVCEILSKHERIGFDCEFIRETSFYPELQIIQVATKDQAWLIDVQAFLQNAQKSPKITRKKWPEVLGPVMIPLRDVLTNSKILKIVHAAQGDQECLWTALGFVAAPIFDTAIGAGLAGLGDSQGLSTLMKTVLGVELKKGHARTRWGVRPLPQELVQYALADVERLVDLGEALFKKVEDLGRSDWALDLCRAWNDGKKTFEPEPDEMARRLDSTGRLDAVSFSVLVELIRWREDRVSEWNIPRKRLADDSVLYDLARVKPKDLKHLSAFRGINVGQDPTKQEALLEAIRKGIEVKHPKPSTERFPYPTTDENRTLSLIKCYVTILADRCKIAGKYLIDSSDLIRILRDEVKEIDAWIKKGYMSPHSASLIGNDLKLFLLGKRGLILENSSKGQLIKEIEA